jgi:hypothetical protein
MVWTSCILTERTQLRVQFSPDKAQFGVVRLMRSSLELAQLRARLASRYPG